MRPKYSTRAIVLSRSPLGEANLLLTLLTAEVGLIRARAQGARMPRARLAPALTTYAESEVMLVRGQEGWRVAGAALHDQWFRAIPQGARARALRIVALLLRLVSGESGDPRLFAALHDFFATLQEAGEAEHEAAEILALLRILHALGLDAGEIPEAAEAIRTNRKEYIARVNRGIEASGL